MVIDVHLVLHRLEQERQDRGPGNESDELAGELYSLIQRIERRSQLDRLVAGLPGGPEVADRAEEALTAQTRLDDADLSTLARAHVDSMRRHVRSGRPGTTNADLELLAGLDDLPIEVVESDHETTDGIWINGVAFDVEPSERTGPLDDTQLDRIGELDGELPLWRSMDHGWNHIVNAFVGLDEDQLHLQSWILAPAIHGDTGAEAVFRLWQAGAKLWIQCDRMLIVRHAATLRSTPYRLEPPTLEPLSGELVEWLAQAGPHGKRVLELAAQQIEEPFHRGPTLLLDGYRLPNLPPVDDRADWKFLHIANNPGIDLAALPRFASLEGLTLRACELHEIPPVVKTKTGLTMLGVVDDPIVALPEWIVELSELEDLSLDGTGLEALPPSISDLPALRRVSMARCGLARLPVALEQARELRTLVAAQNDLTELPGWLAESRLEELDLKNNDIAALPPWIGELRALRRLDLFRNPLETLPEQILDLPDDCTLQLTGTDLPRKWQRARTVSQLRDRWNERG